MSIVSFANPKWADITTVSIEGTGLFDNLMYVIKQHLLEEYNAQRIRGTDYTKAYIESFQAVLGNTTQYISATALNDLMRQKLEIEMEVLELEKEKLELEKQKLQLEIDDWTLRFPLERDKISAETRQINYTTTDVLASQVYLTNARLTSEQQQPSLVQKQISLLDKQIWGFERDSDYKIGKMLTDVWAVGRGTDDTLPFTPAFDAERMVSILGQIYGRAGLTW